MASRAVNDPDAPKAATVEGAPEPANAGAPKAALDACAPEAGTLGASEAANAAAPKAAKATVVKEAAAPKAVRKATYDVGGGAARKASDDSDGGPKIGKVLAKNVVPFERKLVLFQWLLGECLGAPDFEALARKLDDPQLEGLDDQGRTWYAHTLLPCVKNARAMTTQDLLRYDENIVRHWRAITRKRQGGLRPKYFQYLGLLFTEIYLDRYFADPAALRDALNKQVAAYNAGVGVNDPLEPYRTEDLNKFAFWMATGSGKTLLMHINILQYRHYLEAAGKSRDLNKVIVLTPGEDLSRQHMGELTLSGLDAELFAKDGGRLFSGNSIQIIDIHKLREESGQKTIAAEAFENNNLVLVDEGHRGSGGETWKPMRDSLSREGFSFEYSATFKQAMAVAKKPELVREYARCVGFDYSYKYFHGDGYGKDYRILNLKDDNDEKRRMLYLTASLMTFYQQLRIYEDKKAEFAPYLIARPLCVFVGSSVNSVRKIGGREESDVTEVLNFLAGFAAAGGEATERLRLILRGDDGLLDKGDNALFYNSFKYLEPGRVSAEAIHADILRLVFNAPAPAKLHVERRKGADDEIALRIGGGEIFGVINVGDTAALENLCRRYDGAMVVEAREFDGSLFASINDPGSRLHVLIGARRFSEGWSSWRVSTMGLLNVGRTEGSQIIQLFGRGVRLKGLNFALKRSTRLEGATPAPAFLSELETLNVFGVRSDYMTEFKSVLEREGLPDKENQTTVVLPVIHRKLERALKIPVLGAGPDFRREGPRPVLGLAAAGLSVAPVKVDYYARIEARAGGAALGATNLGGAHEAVLGREQLAFLDWDAIYLEMQRFCRERGMTNLRVTREGLRALMAQRGWYTLLIPKSELKMTSFAQTRRWQEIALDLLKVYSERFYKRAKTKFEDPLRAVGVLQPDDPNLITAMTLTIDRDQDRSLEWVQTLKSEIENGMHKDLQAPVFLALYFDKHLYAPLIARVAGHIKVSPVALDTHEARFVEDLRKFCDRRQDWFAGRELYLLRNQSKGKGMGFVEAENFHPDYLLWIVEDGRQWLTFVDPKGIMMLDNIADPKIQFYQTVKQKEAEFGDPDLIMNSFILSNTLFKDVSEKYGGVGKETFGAHQVLFQYDDPDIYVERMLERIVA